MGKPHEALGGTADGPVADNTGPSVLFQGMCPPEARGCGGPC